MRNALSRLRLAETTVRPPSRHQRDHPSLEDLARGVLEVHKVRGRSVNMGSVRAVNPTPGDSLDVPYIALHAMEHGAFTAQGTLHSLRVDPVRLARLLEVATSIHDGGSQQPVRFGRWRPYPAPSGTGRLCRCAFRRARKSGW